MPSSEPTVGYEDFYLSGWEDVISSAQRATCHDYTHLFAKKLATEGTSLNEQSTVVFRLLAAVCSLELREDSEGEPFGPAVFAYSGRSWTVDDFSDAHLDLFAQVTPEIADAELRARMADVLWVRRRNFRMAVLAVRSYMESARRLEEAKGGSLEQTDRLGRARDLAASLGRGQLELYKEVLWQVEEAVDRVDESDIDFRAVFLLEILARSNPEDPSAFARASGGLARKAEELTRWPAARRLWELQAEFRGAASEPEKQRTARATAAETHVKEAEDSLARSGGGYLAAAHHLKLAVEALRRIGDMGERAEQLHARLLEYEHEGRAEMVTHSAETDLTDCARQAETHVVGRSLSDALFSLAFVTSPTDVAHLRQTVEEQFKQFIGMSLMPIQRVNERGMTVGVTPSTAPEGASDEELKVLAEMYSQACQVHYPVAVQGLIEPAKRAILREHRLTPNAFTDFVLNNTIVPLGRESLFARGISAWMYGDMAVAIHLLVPQLENTFRLLLERAGERTTTLSSDGLQQDRTLGSVLTASKLEEVLGPDLLFDLRCLLVERFGANLRNLLSHGLADYASVYSASASYLCWLVLHLCARPIVARAKVNTEGREES